MHDEVNVWYNDPPPPPKLLSPPWEWISAFLPIFQPYDYRHEYALVDQRRKERAHIYIFLTSYKSLNDQWIQQDIRYVAERRVEGDGLSPRIYPVILAPSLWKETSPLALYETMGPKKKTLFELKPVEEGYYEIAVQLSKVIKELQRDLDEEKFAQTRLMAADNPASPAPRRAQPYISGDDELLVFKAPKQMQPPEWLGWVIVFYLIISLMRAFLYLLSHRI
jgi:hypothetical protein